MSVLDAHPTPRPGAVWPPGFRERAVAQAAAIVARDNAPTPLEQITALFPDAVEAAAKALGMAHVPDWVIVVARDALAACIASVTVTTAGTATVVDLRTPPA